MHHCKLLIVDDEASWVALAARCFPPPEYKVYTAETCAEGLKIFDLHKPDCVLLDYNMVGQNAEVFCQKVRSEERLIRTPIIIISVDFAREISAYTVCQADGFVPKIDFVSKAPAVVEMVLRRVNWERGVIKAGDVKLEKNKFQVSRRARPAINLSPDQFQLFYLLLQESPNFLSEDAISKYLYASDFAPQNTDSIRGLIQRLRKKLGRQLGRRIKNKSRLGWIYLQPRLRAKYVLPSNLKR